MNENLDRVVSFRTNDELYRRLKVVAATERKTVQEIINGLIQAWVTKKENE